MVFDKHYYHRYASVQQKECLPVVALQQRGRLLRETVHECGQVQIRPYFFDAVANAVSDRALFAAVEGSSLPSCPLSTPLEGSKHSHFVSIRRGTWD